MLVPGLYVVRKSHHRPTSQRTNLILESRVFAFEPNNPKIDDEWVWRRARGWRDWIKSEYPKDDVFIIERKAD